VIELREMLKSALGDDFVRLYHYGSRVDGGADPDSDYDVLCVTRRPLSRQQRDEILYRQLDIQMDQAVLFDLHFYSEEQLRTPPLSFTPYVQHVTADGIVV
jgi:predicted nucleotidyltransferase